MLSTGIRLHLYNTDTDKTAQQVLDFKKLGLCSQKEGSHRRELGQHEKVGWSVIKLLCTVYYIN